MNGLQFDYANHVQFHFIVEVLLLHTILRKYVGQSEKERKKNRKAPRGTRIPNLCIMPRATEAEFISMIS